MKKKLTASLMVLGLFAVTCGGSVVEREGDAGSAGDDGSAGDKGTGGTVNKGGSGPSTGGWTSAGGAPTYGGSGPGGAGPAGSGAYGGFGYGGAGNSGGWDAGCPPLLACNWCNGKPYYDSMGCIKGWLCANGIDPCFTDPCWQAGCPAGQVCGGDGLCWDTNTCSPKACNGTSNYCECAWSCGASKYQTKCKVSGSSMSCECQQNGSTSMGCGTAGGGGGSPASCQDSCCGFPE